MPDEEFRPGAHDLETPFIFVPHGAPDPVEFKRKYPGWVSFPATFVPHPRPIPKWKIINGQRWPLDKKGRPWPRTRYGRPTCPFDELPEGVPAPGTQYELLRKLENPMLFWEGEPMPTVAEVLAIGAKSRAERAAAAPPPIEPPRAYDGDGLGPARDYMDTMADLGNSLRQAAEDAAFWSAAPTERIQMSDDVLNRNGAAVLAATRKAGPQPIRIAAMMDGRPGEAAEPAAVQLPPGAYYEPLVPLMNRILAVREGDDVAALRREVSEAFYAHGDTIGGNQVNMYLSEMTEPGLTDAHRREIADALARYARADPEEMGQLRRMLTLGGAAIGRGPRGPNNRDPASGSDGPRALTRSEQRGIRNLERRAREHEEKLERYRADPYSQDNDGRLRNAPNDEIRQQIMRRRIEILERDIRNFRNEIRKKSGEVE